MSATATTTLSANQEVFSRTFDGPSRKRTIPQPQTPPAAPEGGSNDARSVLRTLRKTHPRLVTNMIVRIAIATAVMLFLDFYLKLVLTPILAATIVGVVATPLTFSLGQTLQPAIYSICFLGFDDKFLVACLEVTGVKERLATRHAKGKWHDIKKFEKYGTKILIKIIASFIVGGSGLAAIVPLAGLVLSASLSGWVVAWDMVFVALSGMERRGVVRQAKVVRSNFKEYSKFGFWAVLREEIPLVGPACHVYNVYRASFFLEKLYLDQDGTQGTMKRD
mmetsp:Transcript_11503/g.21878  ORF Transcript_11503/g.21878 Transcript_11503/m.21878 type:complete len:278 (-) Transcript_11503:135-968(-)